MKDDTDKLVSHFGCLLHPAREAEGQARAGRLCDYVVFNRWKNGERGRTFECALTSDPGNVFYWSWLQSRVTEMHLQDLAREAVGDSSRREVWADKVEAALGTCLIAERVPELLTFVQDVLPKEPLLQVRALWERTSNSIMLEDNFAVGGGKSPRQTKPFKSEHIPAYRPIKYLVDYITPTWENDKGIWLTGVDSVDHYYDSEIPPTTEVCKEQVEGGRSTDQTSSGNGSQPVGPAPTAVPRADTTTANVPPPQAPTANA